MDEKKEANGVFDLVDGFKQIDPRSLDDFKAAMKDEVIPEIDEIVEKRRLKASESRQWQLKY
jgi:hypothetical protein